MKRFTRSAALFSVLAGALVTAVAAAPTDPSFPARIDFPPPAERVVPPGVPGPPLQFSPDGIASGPGTTFYIGNTSNNLGNPNNGSIWKGDYKTGALTKLVPGVLNGGRAIFGLFADKWGRIWTAGCGPGKSCVFDATTGELLRTYTVVPTATPQPKRLLDDIVVTGEAVYISNRIGGTNFETVPGAVYNFFRIPLGPGGALPPGDPVPAPVPEVRNPAVEEKVLSCGDTSCESAPGIPTYRGSNGIDVLPSGNLVIVSSSEGALWNVNPITGVARRIVTDAAPSCLAPCSAVLPTFVDGLIVDGKTLYITANRPANAAPPGAIIAVELVGSDPTSGHVVAHLNSPTDTLSNPATAAQVGDYIYVIRARPFAATGLPSASDPRTAWITRVDKLEVAAPQRASRPTTTPVVINLTAGKPSEFAFTLAKFSNLRGGTFNFRVTNKGERGHTFKICTKVFAAKTLANRCVGPSTKLLAPGESQALVVTLVKGKHEFLCTVADHAVNGMKGLVGVGVEVVHKRMHSRMPEHPG